MDVPESESSIEVLLGLKRSKTDVGNIAPAPAPLPAPLSTSPASPAPLPPLIDLSDPNPPRSFTALAFTFEEGIIVVTDHSRMTSKYAENVVELNSHMLVTICGESEFLLQELQKKCYLQEQNEGRKTSVAELLKWLAETLSSYKEDLSIGILIAVCNESERGLYCVNGKGEVVKDDILAIGSSSYDAMLQIPLRHRKGNFSVTEAIELARMSICLATCTARQRGSNFSVYHLGSRGGCNKIFDGDLDLELALE